MENKNNRRRTAVGVSAAQRNRSALHHRSSMVHTRDKVCHIHTINMNWPKHELSEYTHGVRHRVQRSTCRNLVILIIMHDYHVRTVNWGTTNTIPQVKHQVIYVIYNLIKCSWLLSLYGGTVCVSYIIDSGHRRRRVFDVLNEDVQCTGEIKEPFWLGMAKCTGRTGTS